MLTDDEVKAQHNDLEMMRRPHLWPHGGKLLPLKRNGLNEQALLVHMGQGASPNGETKPTYMCILDLTIVEVALAIDNGTPADMLARTKDSPMFGQDNLLRTLVDAGWLVD